MNNKIVPGLQFALLGLLTLLCTSGRAQEEAEIVNVSPSGCLQYESDAEGNFIPDFSYAGYRKGEEPIPDVATVLTIEAIDGDNTAHIQAAIDQVSSLPLDANGLRGAVELAAGLYPVAGVLQINADGVVLRGVGQGDDPATNTVIRGEGNSPEFRNLITVGGAPFVSWNSEVGGTRSDVLNAVVPAGARTVRVADPSLYSVGDNVIVYHPSTDAWLAAVNYGDTDVDDPWIPGRLDMVFNRYVEAINLETGQITLDIPVYDRLDRSLAQSEIYILDEPNIRRNCGVENLHVDVVSSGELNEEHVKTAVFLEGVEDAWVTNVTAERFSFACVDMEVANRVTVKDCVGLTPHSPIEGGRRYNFAVNFQSNNVLFTGCEGSDGRHTFVCNAASTGSGIVFHNSTSTRDINASEGHRRWSQALLFDNITFTDPISFTLVGLYNRGAFGTGHGWSAVHSVAWNVTVPNFPPFSPRYIVLQKPPIGQNYAVGCKAFVTGEGFFVFPEGYVELTNEEPAITSLYTTQLEKRLEFGALPDPPSNLRAFDFTDRISLNWDDIAADESGYEVFVSSDAGATFTSLTTLPAETTSYDHAVTHPNPDDVRYRVVTTKGVCNSPASPHASIVPPPVSTDPLFVTYFDQDTLTEINIANAAGSVSTFTLDEECETLQISVTDPEGAPMGGFNPYAVRVRDADGNAVTDLTGRVNVSMRVRSIAPVTISTLFRSGGGGSEERTSLLSFTVPGDTSAWTEFTLAYGSEDLAGFDPAALLDLWFYLDRGTENFNGNEVIFDYIAVGGTAEPELYSPCLLEGEGGGMPLFVDYFDGDSLTNINVNSTAGLVTTFLLDENCETLSLSVTDPASAPLPPFNAFLFRATDANGDPITNITDRVSVTFRARSAGSVVIDFLFRSGGGLADERSINKAVTIPGGLDAWTEFTVTWDTDELAGFDPSNMRDLWFYLDRGDANFNGNELIIDHIAVGGEPDETRVSPCSLGGPDPVVFAEYFLADSIAATGINPNSSAGALTTFDLDTECETLAMSVTDPVNAPVSGFSPYQLRVTDDEGAPITDITGSVSINFRARSAAEVVVDFLFRSGDGGAEERSARKSATVPGDLNNWSEFTLTWEAPDLEGFDPADLRDLWFYLDRGTENFSGNNIIFDHIVISGAGDEMAFSPCSLAGPEPMAFFEYFTADSLALTSINTNSTGGVLTTFTLDTACQTLSLAVTDPIDAPVSAFSPYLIRATDENGDPITNITGIVSVSLRVRSAAEVVLDFLFRSGTGTAEERTARKNVSVPGDLNNWSEFTLTWDASELEGFDPADLRDLWFYIDRGTENFNGNEVIFDQIIIGGTSNPALGSPCFLTDTREVVTLPALTIYPNPAQATVMITTSEPASFSHWTLLDLQGRQISTGTNFSAPIELSPYASGVYLLRMTTNKGDSVVRRIVKY